MVKVIHTELDGFVVKFSSDETADFKCMADTLKKTPVQFLEWLIMVGIKIFKLTL